MLNNIFNKRLKFKKKTANVTSFINVKVKIYYDSQYTSLTFKFKNRVYLKLNHEYYLFNKSNRKLSFQYYDFFFIKRRINRLAYELKLSFV